MKKEALIKLGLEEELAEKVASEIAETLKGFIPKQRFDDVNEVKKQLEQDLLARDTQLEELSKVDAQGLQDKILELQSANETARTDYETRLTEQTFNFALREALTGAKVKNSRAVEALLNKKDISLDGDRLVGLDDQIKALKESDSYLFDTPKPPEGDKPLFTTGQHSPPGNGDAFATSLFGS